jgi:hypothetical protein
MNSISDLISSASITTTIAGNIGVSPFLTMLLIGIIDQSLKNNKDDVQNLVPEDLQSFISSYGAISFWSIMSILEMVGKCIPVVDEMVDSAEVFIVPVMSILGTLSTFGLYDQGNNFDNNNNRRTRMLNNEGGNIDNLGSSVTTAAIRVVQSLVVILGVGLAISIHFLKMLIRMIGVGWATQALTIVEIVFCVATVCISVFVQKFAIFMAVVFIVMMVFSMRKQWKKYKDERNATSNNSEGNNYKNMNKLEAV